MPPPPSQPACSMPPSKLHHPLLRHAPHCGSHNFNRTPNQAADAAQRRAHPVWARRQLHIRVRQPGVRIPCHSVTVRGREGHQLRVCALPLPSAKPCLLSAAFATLATVSRREGARAASCMRMRCACSCQATPPLLFAALASPATVLLLVSCYLRVPAYSAYRRCLPVMRPDSIGKAQHQNLRLCYNTHSCGMIYLSEEAVGWRAVARRWLAAHADADPTGATETC